MPPPAARRTVDAMTEHLLSRNGDASTDAVTVGIVNDYEIVVRGVAAMLAPYDDRVRVVELVTDDESVGITDISADVALFDSFAGRRHTLTRAAEMVATGRAMPPRSSFARRSKSASRGSC